MTAAEELRQKMLCRAYEEVLLISWDTIMDFYTPTPEATDDLQEES